MATSKQIYECYVCKRNGFNDVRVYLDGKTEDGKTIYKNPDMTPHQHKVKQQQEDKFGKRPNLPTGSTQESEQQSVIEKVTIEESIQKGITAQKKFEDLVIEVEGIGVDVNQTRTSLETLVRRLDKVEENLALLIKLVYAQNEKQQKETQQMK